MNLNSYEAKVVGKDNYIYLAKRCNLFTKKWTIGRYKYFKEQLKAMMKRKGK